MIPRKGRREKKKKFGKGATPNDDVGASSTKKAWIGCRNECY